MENRRVYFDYAATTYLCNEALREMMPIFNINFGNSSSIHSFGRDAIKVVDNARDKIAAAIGAKSSEIYFTSGGTEANNWAIKELARANRHKGNHIITSSIEHHSVLDSCKQLEKEGFKVTYLKVDSTGLVSLADLYHAITKDTILISIMTANNEVGTIQHLNAIAQTAKENGVLFHTDAVQALGAVSFHLEDMNIDAMSISSHKVYGPKGVGALYIKSGTRINGLIVGGNQERTLRGGTLNVPAIVGFGKAVEIAKRDMSVNNKKLKMLSDYFVSQLTEKIPDVRFNGHPHQRLPGLISVTFDYIEGESILLMLDLQGIAVSTGSACTSGTLEPSHVLKAMGIDDATAQGTIRFSFGKSNTKEEIDYCVEKLVPIVEKLRSMSPIKKKKKKVED